MRENQVSLSVKHDMMAEDMEAKFAEVQEVQEKQRSENDARFLHLEALAGSGNLREDRASHSSTGEACAATPNSDEFIRARRSVNLGPTSTVDKDIRLSLIHI